MIDEVYNFNLNYVVETIKESRAQTVGLQFPDGFKRKAIGIAEEIEKRTDTRVLISANPCFGACDVDTWLSGAVDILFHFGHAEIPEIGAHVPNTIFIEAESRIDPIPVVEKAVFEIEAGVAATATATASAAAGSFVCSVGLVSTVQFVHTLPRVQRYLAEHGIRGVIKSGDSRIAHPGLVLGCNFSAVPDCDLHLYIGTGDFHALGVAIATKKQVIIADPVMCEVRRPDVDKVLRQRCAAIERSLGAQSFGILVSTRPGQCRKELAFDLRETGLAHGLDAHILIADMVTPEVLLPFSVDFFVNTACPRIAIDDAMRYPVPMLTPAEFAVAIGEMKWEDLVFDEIT